MQLPVVTSKWLAATSAVVISGAFGGYELWVMKNVRDATAQYEKASELVEQGWRNVAADFLGIKDADFLVEHGAASTISGTATIAGDVAEKLAASKEAAALSYTSAAANLTDHKPYEALQDGMKASLQLAEAFSEAPVIPQALGLLAAKGVIDKVAKLGTDLKIESQLYKGLTAADNALSRANQANALRIHEMLIEEIGKASKANDETVKAITTKYPLAESFRTRCDFKNDGDFINWCSKAIETYQNNCATRYPNNSVRWADCFASARDVFKECYNFTPKDNACPSAVP